MAERDATEADVVEVAPSLAGNALIPLYLRVSRCFVEPSKWGECASEAQAFLTAHFITAASVPDGGGGQHRAVASMANGPASVSFVTRALEPGQTNFQSTPYGTTYEQLLAVVRPSLFGFSI